MNDALGCEKRGLPPVFWVFCNVIRAIAAWLALCVAGSAFAATTITSATLDGGVYSSASPYTVTVGQVINACLTVNYSGSGNWKSNGAGFGTATPAWNLGTNCANNAGTPSAAGTYTQCLNTTVQSSPTGTLNVYFGTFTNVACGGAGDSLTWPNAIVVAAAATTTLATGTDPVAGIIIAPGAVATDVDLFTLQTASGTEAITSVTVNLSTSSGVGRLAITNNAGTELGFTTIPIAGSNTITVAGMSATTTLTTFRVRVTPLSHAAMPVPPGGAYAITAPVTAWAGPNTHAGSDTNPNALTIDNLSPSGATATSGSAGNAKTTLNWTTSASADFALTSGSAVYRWAAASAGAEVPAEGSTPVLGSANGTATVACLVSSAISAPLTRIDGAGGSADCTTAALTIGQPYTYKIFQKDANGNYDVGVTVGTFTSSFPAVVSINLASPDPTSPATSVDWTVTFSESVAGVDATDFALVEAGGVSGATITGVTGSGTTWTVTADSGTGAGTLGLNLVDDDTIINTILIPLGSAGAGNGNFTGQAYTVVYAASGYIFTSSACTHGITIGTPGQCNLVTWSPQVAGQDLTGVYITAVDTTGVPTRLHPSQDRTRDMEFGLSCHDPATHAGVQATFAGATLPLCQANGATPSTWSAIVTVTFPGGVPSSNVSYTFNYADVGSVELWMRNNVVPAEIGTSGAFVVKPGGFVLSGIQQTAAPNLANPAAANAAGATFVKAGEMFSVTVTATTIGGVTATPNYGNETAAESVMLTSALVAPVGGSNPAIGGAFGTFTNGVSTGTAFAWDEVGIINLTPSVGDGDYLGMGDVTGTASGNVGRFYAAQFALSGGVIANRTGLAGCVAPAGCDTFTYMGEEMSAVFNLIAKAANGATTLQNYTTANSFAKLDPTAAGNPLALAAVDTGTPRTVAVLDTTTYGVASGSFAAGVATVTAPFAVTRGGSASGPFDALGVGVNPADSDGAALATLDLAVNAGGSPNTHGKVGSTKARYGRMKLSNAHGSELLKLPIPMEAQYWQGQYWAQNNLDDATTIVQNNIKLSNAAVTISGVIKDAAGKWRIVLNKPLTPVSSNVCLDLDTGATGDTSCQATTPLSMPYLQTGVAFDKDPVSRATFGVYKGNNEFIYLRETY